MDSSQSSFRYVRVDQFTPTSPTGWEPFGTVVSCTYDAAALTFTLTGAGASPSVARITLLGPTAFRFRFNPSGDYSQDGSYAVVNPSIGSFGAGFPVVLQNDAALLSVDLGGIRLDVQFQPLNVQVYFNGALVSSDAAPGLVSVPRTQPFVEAVACFKNYPANANYYGFGEKGGVNLRMNGTSMTFFNYDNYRYQGANGGPAAVVPPDAGPGPLNPSEPLYNSIPFLIEDNPNPVDANGAPTGVPYAYGLFFDNESQSYFNIGASSAYAGDLSGRYYFGALYGEIDYYLMVGPDMPAVIEQYTSLTGRPALAPMWSLGYHQGCYGYYDSGKVLTAAHAYRAANIPFDGMHIDVDFQNNYRTFTASNLKFPAGGSTTFAALAALGVKASTNITGIVTIQPFDEANAQSAYSALNSGLAIGAFVRDVREDSTPPPSDSSFSAAGYFVTNESYGCNEGSNPYPSPGAPFDPSCQGTPLGTYGYYADLGKPAVRAWWGGLYKPLLDAGLEMVWQDMTDPATQQSVSDSMPWKTLALNVMMFDSTTNRMTACARIHNVFALNLISATFEGLVSLRQAASVDKRPFIIARGGYAGVQRYAATWTGDSASDYHFLSILIPEILNFGLSGQPMAGADVGGFAISEFQDDDPLNIANGTTGPDSVVNRQVTGGITDPELLVRWTEMSAFFGWFRNHYDGYHKQYQEPFAYAEPVPTICRKYINIRYKLLQLFYDSLYEANQTGLPICRPLCLTDRGDPAVHTSPRLNDQFVVGANLLIAPVVTRNAAMRDVYLPANSAWYAYTDNSAPLQPAIPGGQTIAAAAPLDTVPMFVRAGAIIPHREIEQYVGEMPINPITYDVYPGPDSSHQTYLDDKISASAISASKYRLVEASQSLTAGPPRTQTVNFHLITNAFQPAEPYFFVALMLTSPPASVTVAGSAVPILAGPTDDDSAALLAASTVDAAYYSNSLKTTFVKVFDSGADTSVGAAF